MASLEVALILDGLPDDFTTWDNPGSVLSESSPIGEAMVAAAAEHFPVLTAAQLVHIEIRPCSRFAVQVPPAADPEP